MLPTEGTFCRCLILILQTQETRAEAEEMGGVLVEFGQNFRGAPLPFLQGQDKVLPGGGPP